MRMPSVAQLRQILLIYDSLLILFTVKVLSNYQIFILLQLQSVLYALQAHRFSIQQLVLIYAITFSLVKLLDSRTVA